MDKYYSWERSYREKMKFKKSNMMERILRYYLYFRQGHGTYLAFLIQLANFIVIQYSLLISKIPFLKYLFNSFLAFLITFIVVYIPVCTLIGWLDTKRGLFKISQHLAAQVNPMMRKLEEIEEKLNRVEKLLLEETRDGRDA